MKNISEIRPCPICGEIPDVFQWGSFVYTVWHSKLEFVTHADMDRVSGRTDTEAIKKWNSMVCKKFVGNGVSR